MFYYFNIFVSLKVPCILKNYYIKLFFTLFIITSTYGQYYTHDIGILAGSSKFQTDFGERGDFASGFDNGGMSISLAHYLSFYKRNTRWNSSGEMYKFVMIKSEFNFMPSVKLDHYGKWILGSSDLAKQLKAMHGEISMLNLGVSIQYYLKNLEKFSYAYSDLNWNWNPFVTFGIRYSLYKNELVSDLGDWRQDITVLPRKYRVPGALKVGKGNAFAFTMGLGTRYKITEKLDLATQFNWQIYFSDAIDGLQANVIENKNNDWFFNFQIGVIYHLNFNRPLFE